MAGRICDQLKGRYGDDSVYMDIDNIPLGIDFRDHIYSALDQADVLVVIVGPRWLGTRRGGRSRIMHDRDLVRVEVETALKRNIPVVPILVDGATMPDAASLPDSIQALTFRNAAAVDAGVDFHQQMERLTRSLDHIVGAKAPFVELLQHAARSSRRLPLVFSSIAAIAVISIGLLWWSGGKLWWPGGKQNTIGGPMVVLPPAGRSIWSVEKSTVYLVPTGDRRQFFLVEPSLELGAQGAQAGALLFDGRKIVDAQSKSYEGKVFVFVGRCGTRDYDASGPITNDDETVTLVGKAPHFDAETCVKIDERERTLIFNFQRNN